LYGIIAVANFVPSSTRNEIVVIGTFEHRGGGGRLAVAETSRPAGGSARRATTIRNQRTIADDDDRNDTRGRICLRTPRKRFHQYSFRQLGERGFGFSVVLFRPIPE